jgi:uncharacterized protein YfaS (alpha-2-macroglobulin family)
MKKFTTFLVGLLLIVFGFCLLNPKTATKQAKAEDEEDKEYIYVFGENKYSRMGIISQTVFEEPILNLATSAKEQRQVKVDLYQANYQILLDFIVHDEENNQLQPKVKTDNLEKLVSLDYEIANQSEVLNLPAKEKGIYLMHSYHDRAENFVFLVRSDTATLLKEGDRNMIFWTQNLNDLKTQKNVTIETYNLLNSKKRLGSYSDSGRGVVETPLSEQVDLAIVSSNDSVSVLPINLNYINSTYNWDDRFEKRELRELFYVFLDRPLYKPGDTAYFKVFARNDDDAKMSLLNATSVVEVSTGWGETREVIFKQEFQPKNGSFDGEFNIPENAVGKEFRVSVELKKELEEENNRFFPYYSWRYRNSTSFMVEHYRKPEYTLAVDSAKNQYVQGQEVKVDFDLKYFTGQPVKDQSIDYTIYAREIPPNRSIDPDNYRYYSYYSYNDKKLDESSVKTNQEGQAQLVLPDWEKINSTETGERADKNNLKTGSNYLYTIEANFKNESNVPVRAKKNIMLYAGDFSFEVKNKQYSYKVNEEISLDLALTPIEDNFDIKNKEVKAKIELSKWDYDSKPYQKIEKEVTELTALTDYLGDFNLNFTPKETGRYTITLSVIDKNNNLITRQITFRVHDKDSYWGQFDNDAESSEIEILGDKEEYLPTDRLNLNILSKTPNRDLFVTLERGYVYDYKIVSLAEINAETDFNLNSGYIPNIYVSAASFNPTELNQSRLDLKILDEQKKLNLKIKANKEKYEPGETVELDLLATDKNGQGVQTEITLWAVDKAIFELAEGNLRDPFDFFWHERNNDTSLSHSLKSITVYAAEKGGGGGESSIRSVLEDTAYWNPKILTDYSGKAHLSFKLPDNLTTWKLSAVGITPKTQVGSLNQDLVVTRDVIVRPVLPNLFRTGDKAQISALVYNNTETDQPFEVKLTTPQTVTSVENPVQTVKIKTGDYVQVFFKVNPKNLNPDADFQISATSLANQAYSDAIQMKVPIEEFGYYLNHFEAKTGPSRYSFNLRDNLSQEKTEINLSVYASPIGSLNDAMQYLITYPHGCTEQTMSRLKPLIIVRENPGLFASIEEEKDTQKMIESGIKRLKELQNDDGGWDWWKSGESDAFVTLYVVENLIKLQQTGYELNDKILDRAKDYLLSYSNNKSKDDEKNANAKNQTNNQDISKEKLISRNYALTLLKAPDEAARAQINDFSGLTTKFLSLAVLNNLANGYTDPKTNGLEELLNRSKTEQNLTYWESGEQKYYSSQASATAHAIKALLQSPNFNEEKKIVNQAIGYLNLNRKNRYWSNTYGTAITMEVLTEYYNRYELANTNFNFSVYLNDKEIRKETINHYTDYFEIAIDPSLVKGEANLEIKQKGTGKLFSSLTLKEYLKKEKNEITDNGIQIKREYTNLSRPHAPIAVGDLVGVDLKISGTGLPSNSNYGLIHDRLPSGLIPVNPNLKNETSRSSGSDYYSRYSTYYYEYDLDGVKIPLRYFNNNQTYSYQARAIIAGDFKIPPAQAELMYQPQINGISKSGHLTITQEPIPAPQSHSKPLKSDPQNTVSFDEKPPKGQANFNFIKTYLSTLIIVMGLIALYFVNKKPIDKWLKKKFKKKNEEEK